MLISVSVALGSCDQERGKAHAKDIQDSNLRGRSRERAAGESKGSRERLRASLEAAKQLQNPEERERAISDVGRNALESAPDITAEAIRELLIESPQTAELIQSCVSQLMKSSRNAALAWSESLREPSLVEMAREQIAIEVAETEPQHAIELLSESGSAGESDQTIEHVLQIWTEKSPADAATWASRLPAGESRNSRLKTVVNQWLLSNPATSTAWVSSLREPDLRSESIRLMAESLQGYPPFIRESMLKSADSSVRSEIERQIELQQPPPVEEPIPEN